jgi:branched-chain amino acid transport system ATP-binding protein
MMEQPILSLTRMAVSYGKVEAVREVSIDVPQGTIVTVIGANGAGKSSLLNAAMGLIPGHGSVRIDGEEMRHRATEVRLARGLALVPERRELFGSMTVADNLALGGYLRPKSAVTASLAAVYDRFPRLAERRSQIAGTLSGGERQMLAMGRALMSAPRVLLLDEPSLGLAPRIVADILDIVVGLKATGVSVLLVEQNARAALGIADVAHVMELGAVTLSGPARQLLDDPRVVESYLGLAHAPITLEDP